MHIKSPHDHFFRAAMAEKRVAQGFFKQHLPEKILKRVDLASLQLRKDTFIDTQLHASASDILFSVHFDGKLGYLYTLVEHQRKPDPLMAFRFLYYLVQIIAQDLKKTGRKELPIVYPILFFNGEATYPYSTDMFDLFGASRELAEQILFQPFQLVDLTQISDEALKQEVWSSILQVFMKHAFNRDVRLLIQDVLSSLQVVEREGGSGYIKEAFTYLLNTSETNNPEQFIHTIKGQLSFETEESIMTLAQQFEARGIEKGIEKGMTKGKEEEKKSIALRLLRQGMSLEQVAGITELSVEAVEKLHKANSH